MRGQLGQGLASTRRRGNATSLVAVWLLAAMLGCDGGWAQAADRLANQQELDRNRELLENSQAHASALVSRIEGLTEDRAELDAELVRTGELIKKTEAEMTASEDRLRSLKDRQDHLRTSLKHQNRSIAALLMAMQRLGRNPPPAMITRRDDALEAVRAAKLMGSVLPGLKGRAKDLVDQLEALAAVTEDVQKEHDHLSAETRRLADARKHLSYLMDSKRRSLRLRQLELAQVQRTVQEIGDNVASLEQLIQNLDRTVPRLVEDRKIPPHEPLDEERSLAGRPNGLLVPFHKAKRQLPLPAVGLIELDYGAPTNFGKLHEGVLIKTRYGAQVTAPCNGLVLFAGPFRTYSNVVILKVDKRYHIVLAGLSRIDVQPGQSVLMGEPLGVMRDVQLVQAGSDAPRLYVEFRENGLAINPQPWWADNHSGKV